MIIDKVVVSVMASVAAITVLSACSSQEQLTAGSSQSASDFDSLLISAETSDKLSEWSSGMPLGKHDAFISDLGIDISKATLPNPVLILTRQAQAVVPYGTKCVIVFTSEKVSSPSRISGWIAYRFNGPQVKYGFGNWGRSAIKGWLQEKQSADCSA